MKRKFKKEKKEAKFINPMRHAKIAISRHLVSKKYVKVGENNK